MAERKRPEDAVDAEIGGERIASQEEAIAALHRLLGEERERVRHLEALRATVSNQAVTIRRLRFLALKMADIAHGLDDRNDYTGDILIARKEAKDGSDEG